MSATEQIRDSFSPQGQCVGGQRKPSLARRRYQKGVLELRGNTWTVKFREDMIQPDGSAVKRVEVRRFVGTLDEFPTRKLARRRADEIVSRVNGLDYKPIMVATFAEYSEVWDSRALAMMKPSTQKAARAHLRIYLVPQFGKLRLDEIGISAVQSLVARMAAKNLSRHMIMNVLYTLCSALKSARKWGYLCGEFRVADLTIPAGGVAKVPRFFTLAEAIAIIDAAESPWRTIFAVAAMTGMRPGEVLGLTVGDLDFERRLIHIRQTAYYSKLQTPKSRSSVAPVPMPDPLAGMLREYLQTWKPNAAELLFATRKGTPFCENKIVQKRLWPILDKLKIPRCGMHAFRHMYASLLVQGGASPAVAQRQLRHSDVMTTMRHYTHILGSEQRDAAEKIAAQLLPVATDATKVAVQVEWLH
ncbi:MAG TPA: site-specific integrase [Candidatus Acidoferrales bacterium]|nr:site-specific integrase [Candidatus Acidoferrales bacterium]